MKCHSCGRYKAKEVYSNLPTCLRCKISALENEKETIIEILKQGSKKWSKMKNE
jgi:hypothetical protein